MSFWQTSYDSLCHLDSWEESRCATMHEIVSLSRQLGISHTMLLEGQHDISRSRIDQICKTLVIGMCVLCVGIASMGETCIRSRLCFQMKGFRNKKWLGILFSSYL